MKKKHLYGAMLWTFLVTANLCTGCSDDILQTAKRVFLKI